MKIYLFLIFLCLMQATFTLAEDEYPNQIKKIEYIVSDGMNRGKIPGLALVLIKDGKIILNKGYGIADIKNKIPVSLDTLFELGSTTKAFTGFAVLKLSQENKINLASAVNEYITWFYTLYKGEKVVITVKDCLYHNSGIPFQTLTTITSSIDPHELENTVKKINGTNLIDMPSRQFHYATINYDILGLLIEKITHQSYENYMTKEVLQPLNLTHSFFNREQAYNDPNMAVGYKLEYLHAVPYIAPTYKGNTPAGYLISNAHDMGLWLLYQLGDSTLFPKIFLKSHEPNRSTPAFFESSFYAAGWFMNETGKGAVFSHSGENPNFSSYFTFSPEHNIAVAVLANLHSNYTTEIGKSAMSILIEDKVSGEIPEDMLLNVDFFSVIILIIVIPTLLGLFYFYWKTINCIINKKRTFYSCCRLISLFFTFLIFVFLSLIFYYLPNILFFDLDWKFVQVWGPNSFIVAVLLLYLTIILSLIFFQLLFLFPINKFVVKHVDVLNDRSQ